MNKIKQTDFNINYGAVKMSYGSKGGESYDSLQALDSFYFGNTKFFITEFDVNLFKYIVESYKNNGLKCVYRGIFENYHNGLRELIWEHKHDCCASPFMLSKLPDCYYGQYIIELVFGTNDIIIFYCYNDVTKNIPKEDYKLHQKLFNAFQDDASKMASFIEPQTFDILKIEKLLNI